jgi:hypothetical protein
MEAEQQGLKIDSNRFIAMANDLSRRLAGEGLDPDIHPRVTAAMRRVQSEADRMKPKQPGGCSRSRQGGFAAY